MAESYVQVATDGSGKQVDTYVPGSYHRQVVVLGDPNTAAAVQALSNADPAGTEYAMIVRPIFETVAASANSNANVSLGNSTGKANVCKTGSLVTTATTADQVILTYTVTTGKTFYLLGFNASVRLTTYATTATNFGNFSLENPSGTKLSTAMVAHAGVIYPPYQQEFFEPLPIASATVIRIVCTPAATTSFTWQGNIWGYER